MKLILASSFDYSFLIELKVNEPVDVVLPCMSFLTAVHAIFKQYIQQNLCINLLTQHRTHSFLKFLRESWCCICMFFQDPRRHLYNIFSHVFIKSRRLTDQPKPILIRSCCLCAGQSNRYHLVSRGFLVYPATIKIFKYICVNVCVNGFVRLCECGVRLKGIHQCTIKSDVMADTVENSYAARS